MKHNQASPAVSVEQRQYFRVEDMPILHYRELPGESEDTICDRPRQPWVEKLTLRTRFDAITREMQPLRRILANRSKNLSDYLHAVDKKLDILAESLLHDVMDDIDSEPQRVNIGAGGISFSTDRPIMAGNYLELCLILLPENAGIHTYGRVVGCKRNAGKPDDSDYRISVQFECMSESERDIITRHVLKKEQLSRQHR